MLNSRSNGCKQNLPYYRIDYGLYLEMLLEVLGSV